MKLRSLLLSASSCNKFHLPEIVTNIPILRPRNLIVNKSRKSTRHNCNGQQNYWSVVVRSGILHWLGIKSKILHWLGIKSKILHWLGIKSKILHWLGIKSKIRSY